MQRGVVVVVISLVLYGCSGESQKNKITVPKQPSNFYNVTLDKINKKLDIDPQNTLLVEQKLYYCGELNWPADCITALDMYQQKNGMINRLVKEYIAYYKRHEKYRLLLELIDRWNSVYDLKNNLTTTYIDCLTQLEKHRRAKAELREFLRLYQSLDDLVFSSEQYLKMKDTLMSVYILSKVRKLNPENELMWEYGNLLFGLDYKDVAIEVLDDFMLRNTDKNEFQLTYAKLLESEGYRMKARELIKPLSLQVDTIAYLLLDWYKKDFLWDSATYIIKQIIMKDSTNREALLRASSLYEERGLLLTSLPNLEYLMQLNPNDTLVQQRIDRIRQKLEYLYRLRFEESKIRTLELQPKIIKN